ncbi:MAG: hypothetical protein ACFFE8_17130 [Candidatus Heimdallarchaeota archaeon]
MDNKYLVITIDVEEDNWGEFNLSHYTTKNIERIPRLQKLFDTYNVKPTYLLSYPVASDDRAISIFNDILKTGNCEIGTHLHPWNTPPLVEERNERNSMLGNLPSELQFQKINTLHNTIRKNLNILPISFRGGRWSFTNSISTIIHKLGYKVDTSIMAYTDRRHVHGPNFSGCSPFPYKFSVNDIFKPIPDGDLFELPATIGFLQTNSEILRILNSFCSIYPFRLINAQRLFKRLNFMNKVSLSPEMNDGQTMIELTENLEKWGQRFFNMFFHSTSLLTGLSPFTKTVDDEKRIVQYLAEYLQYAKNRGFKFITLSDTLRYFTIS